MRRRRMKYNLKEGYTSEQAHQRNPKFIFSYLEKFFGGGGEMRSHE